MASCFSCLLIAVSVTGFGDSGSGMHAHKGERLFLIAQTGKRHFEVVTVLCFPSWNPPVLSEP